MGNLKINDLVDKQAIEDLKSLDTEITNLKRTYVDACKELSDGIKLKIEGIDDLEKLNKIVTDNTKKSEEATEKLNENAEKRKKIIEQTTNTISRELAEMEKENQAKRESYSQDEKALKIAHDILGTKQANMRQLAKITSELKQNAAQQKALNDAEKNGSVTTQEAISKRAALLAEEQKLKTAKAELNKVISNEEKMNQAAEGSYKQLSLRLEMLKKAYKELNEEEKNGSNGKILSAEISKLDAHLKDLAGDMGEFQRNVGNYAIAQGQYADTIQDKLFGVLGISNETGQSLVDLGKNGSAGFASLKTNAVAFFKSLMGFLANPAVLATLGIAGSAVLFKWLFDYNKGLEKATMLTKQFTGASGETLKKYRTEVQALADTYDKDFNEVLQATNVMSKQFGISFDEAFKYVKDGFVSGADVTGEFLENLKEYPAYFKEAGLSASQFVAITTQANKQGIYSDKGIDVIKEGNLRIREMTTATADALEGIGISSVEVQKKLESGAMNTFDVMQMVSAKLEEYPETSAAVGTALADIFGGPGEDAGLQYIKLLKKIDVNLDAVKAKEGELAKLQEANINAEIEMQSNIAALFDFTGGSFEELTTKAKVFLKQGITKIIHGIINLSNYFIGLYNDSVAFRQLWNATLYQIKNGLDLVGNLFNLFKDTIKATGDILKGAFTLDWDLFKKGLSDYAVSFKKLATAQMKDMDQNYKEWNDNLDKKLKPIVIPATIATEEDKSVKGGGGKKGKGKTLAEQAKDLANRKKFSEALKQSALAIMDAGFDKEMERMAIEHDKRLSEIKGNTEEENQLRDNITRKYMKDMADYTRAYEETRMKTDITNKLAAVKEGSDEEFGLKMELLDIERQAEIRNAEAIGADVAAIEAKYNALRTEMHEEYAQSRVDKIAEDYSVQETLANIHYSQEQTALLQQYADGLISKETYEIEKAKLEEDYAVKSAQKSVEMLEMQLSEEDLSVEERKNLELELAKAKDALERQMTDNVISEAERQKQADDAATQKRLDNLGKVSEALNAMNELGNAIFEGKISKLEEEQQKNQEAYDAEVERIDKLAESGAITTEEAEERKRAAEEKTKKKNDEIEKQKRKLQYKQAVWNKMTQLAQTGIATARAIMEAMPNIPLAAMVGAMGAIQAATIIATPIPKYAKGTDSHPGGMAVVGDGGKQEMVLVDGKAWITPDNPTLVNLPRGAEVYPDASLFDAVNALQSVRLDGTRGDNSSFVVNNDYSRLERGQNLLLSAFKRLIEQNEDIAERRDFNDYKNRFS